MTPIEECPQIVQQLKVHVDRLADLLKAPEPGLWSWMECVAQEVKAIHDMYGKPVSQPQIEQLSDDQLTSIVKSVFEDAGFQPNEHPECLLAIIVARRVRDMARSGTSEVSQ
jgi:hypothetical protein